MIKFWRKLIQILKGETESPLSFFRSKMKEGDEPESFVTAKERMDIRSLNK